MCNVRSGDAQVACVLFAAMSTQERTNKFRVALSLSFALLTLAPVARPAAGLIGEDLAVVQAMAAIITREAERPYENLYFASEFEGAPFVLIAMENPDRTDFCGLTREGAVQMVNELEIATSTRVQFDKETAKAAGLRLGRRKDARFPYLVLSRPVFGPGKEYAWVGVELNGSRGAVMRLDKVNGVWRKTSRCGAWVKSEG
jgi:hypothetical protein